ncbi:hypothetical protein J7I98_23705 [Streptomyces sp. ISL-98]|nr:hypothetical protein [Streptomyces sp. ISL-98]
MISFRELARRLVSEGVVERMTHQRISQIRKEDPAGFPPVVQIGRSMAVDYRRARPYFVGRKLRPGERTDLKDRPAE